MERIEITVTKGHVVGHLHCQDRYGRAISTPVWRITATDGKEYEWATEQKFFIDSVIRASVKYRYADRTVITRGRLVG